MLAAMILLGLLPLAALPLIPEPPEEAEPGQAQTQAEAGATGAVHRVAAGEGEAVFAQFDPAEDVVEVDLTSVSGPLVFDVAGDRVAFAVTDETVAALRFPGQETAPAAAILLRLTDGEGEAYEISLADARLEEAALTGTALALDDPDPADPPGPVPDGPALAPDDPDLPDPPGPIPDDPDLADPPGPAAAGTVLEPDDPDAPGEPAEAAGAAPGDAPWWRTAAAADPGVVIVEAFEVGADILRLTIERPADGAVPAVAVGPSDDGQDGLVTVNGALVAVLLDAPDATPGDIHAEWPAAAAG